MASENLWTRVRKARLFGVLAVYLGASWAVLQVVNELGEALSLPPWLSPVAVILLLVGLLIILATAWVQSHPLVEQRQATDEIPRSWELDLEGALQSVTSGAMPHLTWARTLVAGAAAFLLLFGVAGMYVVINDRGESFLPAGVQAAAAPDGIAVLPFSVRGAGIGEWREGMVDLLATGLDGAGGLRSIASATVLARWHEAVPDSTAYPDRAAALEVARRTGARYALLGGAVAIGPQVRLTGDVLLVDNGQSIGQVQAQGPADSVLALVDQLAVQTLAHIGDRGDGELPRVNVAAITTASLPALKAYLQGEALFRRGDFAAAANAYEEAVRADSLFGLAYYRLSQTYGWGENINSQRGAAASERAMTLLARMPDREALLVRLSHAVGENDPLALQLGAEATRKYPDDPEAWYQRGEAELHVREGLMGWDEAEASFTRAVQHAPRFSPYRIHLIEHAARYQADSALLAERLDAFEELAPDSWMTRRYRLVQAMAFGDSAASAAALAVTDSMPVGQDHRQISFGLNNPLLWDANERFLRRTLQRAPPALRGQLRNWLGWGMFFSRGHLTAAARELADPAAMPSARLELHAHAASLGFPLPTTVLDSALAEVQAGRLTEENVWPVALYAALRGAWDAHASAITFMRAELDSVMAAGDSVAAARGRAQVRALEAYGIWKRGQPAEAARILESVREAANMAPVRWWLGVIHRDQGNLREAERYFRTFLTWDPDPLASYELGKIHQALGNNAEARERLEFFVANWAEADTPLQPLVEDAKRRLTELQRG
ncbi:MAG: tetratricopeptide repeat protein [Gemmatimonadota bacterium]